MEGGNQQQEEKKADHINVRVIGNDNTEVFFKIRKTTPMRKLMEAYCEKQGKTFNSVRFLFDGNRIHPDKTAEMLKIENDDVIEVQPEQTGG